MFFFNKYLIKINNYLLWKSVKKAERPRILLLINIVHKLEDNYNIEESNEYDDIQNDIESFLQEQKKDNVNINFKEEEENIWKAIKE